MKGRYVSLVLFIVALILSCGVGNSPIDSTYRPKSQAIVFPNSFPIVYGNSTQTNPEVAFDVVNGNYLVVWTDYRNYTTQGTDIYMKHCLKTELLNQSCSGPEIPVADSLAGESEPAIAFNSDARQFLVIWTDGYNGKLKGRILNSDGSFTGDPFVIQDSGMPSQSALVYNEITRQWTAAWREEQTIDRLITVQGLQCLNSHSFLIPGNYIDPYTITLANIGSDGTVHSKVNYSRRIVQSYEDSGSSINMSLLDYHKESSPVVFYDPVTGENYVAWAAEAFLLNVSVGYSCPEEQTPPCNCNYEVSVSPGGGDTYPRVYIRKQSIAKTYDLAFSEGASYHPSVVVDPNTRRAFVVWEEQTGQDKDIKGVVLDLSNFTGYQQVSVSTAPSDQTSPRVSFDPVNQRYIVLWEDARNGSVSIPNIDIFGQFVDPQGQLSGSNFSISTSTGNQLMPVAAYGNDEFPYFFILWKDGQNPGDADIHGTLWQYSVAPQMEITDENDIPLISDTIDFGSVKAGQSAVRIFRIHNKGNAALTLQDHIGPDEPFSVSTSWPTTINPGTYYDMTVVFAPPDKGAFNSQIIIRSDGGSKTIYLSGSGTAPNVLVAPSSVDFGSVTVGSVSLREIVISNSGNADLTVSSITVTPPFKAEVSTPFSLQPGEKATLIVEFQPDKTGTFTGQLTIQSDDPDSPDVSVNLQGVATEEIHPPTDETNNETKKSSSLGCSIGGTVATSTGVINTCIVLLPALALFYRKIQRKGRV